MQGKRMTIEAASKLDWRQTAGAQLYLRARRRIPGGTQLLSKRPELYLPELWPSYYSRCKGCEVWDLEGRRFVEMSTNGIGTCLLGYSDDDVNAAVKQAVDNGSMCTLNAPTEVELADLLCELHPWAQMVRYARTGGESMAVAVRIARAFTQRDKVCICGYHGWSDWYVAANLAQDEALSDHLLPGIPSRGVPSGLRGSVLPFRYNRIEELEAHVRSHGRDIAAIVMEPIRNDPPKDGFLEKVRKIASDFGAVLIIDEITIGWRQAVGGTHLKLGLQPDIAVFAKAISNGFPMGAVVGREEVMQAAQSSFISSTYWTEALGPAAALATIRKMRAVNLPDYIDRIGRKTQEGMCALVQKHKLNMKFSGPPVLLHFDFDYGESSRAVKTLLTQLMLERGFLVSGRFYPTLAHTPAVVEEFLSAMDESFAVIRRAVEEQKVLTNLKGPIAHGGFQRLT